MKLFSISIENSKRKENISFYEDSKMIYFRRQKFQKTKLFWKWKVVKWTYYSVFSLYIKNEIKII